MTDNTEGLKTLTPPNASVPNTRITSAAALQGRLNQFVNNDNTRSRKRALVQGLIDGNPPYSSGKLREMGRADACNVNWGTPLSYVTQAEGIFYDLFSEAPTYLSIWTNYTDQMNPQVQEDWCRIMSEEAHEALYNDPRWDYVIQASQRQMVAHGCGPLFFEDEFAVIPRYCKCGDLKVPDNSESATPYWEEAVVLHTYKPHELYQFISNEEAARDVGWNVAYVKKVIMDAMPERQSGGQSKDWEYYQEQFKANSFASTQDNAVIKVAFWYWKEFDGKITQAIIEQETQGGSGIEFLYRKIGRFQSWDQCIHPMYYDKGNGRHYTVTGLGVKMYGAMAYENRLRCKLADDAMAPKTMFKPTTEGNAPFNAVQLGPFLKVPAGWDMQQMAVNGVMQDGMLMLQELSRTTSNNLAQYRQSWSRPQGNPATATQIQSEMQQQYAVAGTAISRYYKQLDTLYTEIVKRLCKSDDKLAKEWRSRCAERGVPKQCFTSIRKVEANRVSGQGSAALRQMSLDAIMQLIGRLPEEGQDALIIDWIAARSGQRNAKRYYPIKQYENMGTRDEVEAALQISAAKTVVPPVVASNQDPAVFASAFLGAAGQALGTVEQGANPMEVLQFVDTLMPAAQTHLQRLSQDPTRKQLAQELGKMFMDVGRVHDQVMQKTQAMMQEQAQQQAQAGPSIPPEKQQEIMIKQAEAQQKLQAMQASHQQRMRQRAEIHQFDMVKQSQQLRADIASKDLSTASEIRRKRVQTAADVATKAEAAAAEPAKS